MALDKRAHSPVIAPGDLLTYTLTYSNVGSAIADAVVITETVPARTTFVVAKSTAGWRCPQGTTVGTVCFYLIAELIPAQQGRLYFVVKVDDHLALDTSIYNMASIGLRQAAVEEVFSNNRDALTVKVGAPTDLPVADEPRHPYNFRVLLPLVQTE